MGFSHSLGDVLFKKGWSFSDLAAYTGPGTEARLVRDTGYDDTAVRKEMCLEALREAKVITQAEYLDVLTHSMEPDGEYADPFIQPAPRIEAVLPSGKKVTFGESLDEPKKPRI